jgi:hypothetical protein
MKQGCGYIASVIDLNQSDLHSEARKLAEWEHSCSPAPKLDYIDPQKLMRFPSIGRSSSEYAFAADCHGGLEECLVEE